MTDAVTLSVSDGVAVITLNQPEQRNALTDEIKEGLDRVLTEVPRDVRCIVLEGAGPAFSAGGDLDAMADRLETNPRPEARVRDLEPVNQTVRKLARFPVPTIAKVDGAVVGAGMALMLACDIQLVSERSKFGVVFSRVGLSPDAGTTFFLTKAVGPNIAKELAYTGDIFGAERALNIGLVNHVYDDETFDEETDEFIEKIAEGPTVAHQYTKELIDAAATNSLEESMQAERAAGGLVYATDDHREGVEAFQEDRDPDFEGR